MSICGCSMRKPMAKGLGLMDTPALSRDKKVSRALCPMATTAEAHLPKGGDKADGRRDRRLVCSLVIDASPRLASPRLPQQLLVPLTSAGRLDVDSSQSRARLVHVQPRQLGSEANVHAALHEMQPERAEDADELISAEVRRSGLQNRVAGAEANKSVQDLPDLLQAEAAAAVERQLQSKQGLDWTAERGRLSLTSCELRPILVVSLPSLHVPAPLHAVQSSPVQSSPVQSSRRSIQSSTHSPLSVAQVGLGIENPARKERSDVPASDFDWLAALDQRHTHLALALLCDGQRGEQPGGARADNHNTLGDSSSSR